MFLTGVEHPSCQGCRLLAFSHQKMQACSVKFRPRQVMRIGRVHCCHHFDYSLAGDVRSAQDPRVVACEAEDRDEATVRILSETLIVKRFESCCKIFFGASEIASLKAYEHLHHIEACQSSGIFFPQCELKRLVGDRTC